MLTRSFACNDCSSGGMIARGFIIQSALHNGRMQVIDDNTRLVIDRLTLTNLLFNLLDAQILVDPIPHVGVLKDGEIRRGINGKGLKVEGYKNPDLDWKEGQKVLYRIER